MYLRCVLLTVAAAALLSASQASAPPPRDRRPDSPPPARGFVPDEKTAIRIGEAVALPIYGEAEIKRQRPFHVHSRGPVWVVFGTHGGDLYTFGGSVEVHIRKKDGCILKVYIGK